MRPKPCPDLRRSQLESSCVRSWVEGSMTTILFGWTQRELNTQPRSRAIFTLKRTAERFNSLAHTSQAVAFDRAAAPAIVLNFDPAVSVHRNQPQITIMGSRMAHDVGHGFAHHQRNHALLRWRQANFFGLGLHNYARSFQRRFGGLEFGFEAVGAISANRASNIGQSRARGLLDVGHFGLRALRIVVDQLACQLRL